jgi:ParB-like chromosome segregation protein Spo0J
MDVVERVDIPAIELLPISNLRVDGKNPNVMSKPKLEALKENMKRFGFLVPIIANRDLLIADGEHRLLAARELEMTEVPVIRLNVGEVDRRILRQVLNKLRGEHDFFMDAEEFKFLEINNSLDDISSLLAIDKDDLGVYLNKTITPFKEKEVSPDSMNLQNKCPKCGFEFE